MAVFSNEASNTAKSVKTDLLGIAKEEKNPFKTLFHLFMVFLPTKTWKISHLKRGFTTDRFRFNRFYYILFTANFIFKILQNENFLFFLKNSIYRMRIR